MELGELARALPQKEIRGVVEKIKINGIAYDSREVKPGDLFVAIKGFTYDGHDFITEAVERGAVAVVAQREVPVPAGVTLVIIPDTRQGLARLSTRFYRHPSDKMRLVAVTGTNGKTTTTHLIRAILLEAGYGVGLIGTINHIIGEKRIPVTRTTPESLDLQRLLAQMVEEGIQYAVMEVSSHALELGRVTGCEFDVAVLTNITQDHLDFHHHFQDYVDAKTKLFSGLGPGVKETAGWPKSPKLAVLNADDPNFEYIRQKTTAPVLTYGLEAEADVTAGGLVMGPEGVSFVARTPVGAVPLNLSLAGRFNVYNALAAVAVATREGVKLATVKKALEQVRGVQGRMEPVDEGQDFTVLVDYAHTPDSLENVLRTVREFTRGRLITVFGCGGDRDRGKRPLMGEIAVRYSDHVVITSDNPRGEDPEGIITEIVPGAERVRGGSFEVEVDRAAAIRRAVQVAQRDDVVLIAGKGHETYQIFRTRTVHFDDREVAREAIREKLAQGGKK